MLRRRPHGRAARGRVPDGKVLIDESVVEPEVFASCVVRGQWTSSYDRQTVALRLAFTRASIATS